MSVMWYIQTVLQSCACTPSDACESSETSLQLASQKGHSKSAVFFKLKKVNSFPSYKTHRAALISVSLALSQTPAYTARPQITWCACLLPSFHWYSLHPPTEGWPGWVDPGGWLHTEMVYLSVTHPSTTRAQHRITLLITT